MIRKVFYFLLCSCMEPKGKRKKGHDLSKVNDHPAFHFSFAFQHNYRLRTQFILPKLTMFLSFPAFLRAKLLSNFDRFILVSQRALGLNMKHDLLLTHFLWGDKCGKRGLWWIVCLTSAFKHRRSKK